MTDTLRREHSIKASLLSSGAHTIRRARMHAVPRILLHAVIIGLIQLFSVSLTNASAIPDRIMINKLQQYYAPVSFDHAGHIKRLTDCGVCHHHTTGAMVKDSNCARCHKNSGAFAVVSCKGCHVADPFTPEALKQQRDRQPPLYHRDKPGLKAAYHMGCIGCHQKMGGPTGCQDCHKRNDSGDAIFKSGSYAPKAGVKAKSLHH